MTYTITWEDHGVWLQFHTVFTAAINGAATEAIYQQERVTDVQYLLWDLSGVTTVDFSPDDAEMAAGIDAGASTYMRDIKMVLVVSKPELLALAQEYIQLASTMLPHWEFQVFDTLEAARSWLASLKFQAPL